MASQPQEGYPRCHWRMVVLQVQGKNLEFWTPRDGLRFVGKQGPKLKFFFPTLLNLPFLNDTLGTPLNVTYLVGAQIS